jgi:hypothetical protein
VKDELLLQLNNLWKTFFCAKKHNFLEQSLKAAQGEGLRELKSTDFWTHFDL